MTDTTTDADRIAVRDFLDAVTELNRKIDVLSDRGITFSLTTASTVGRLNPNYFCGEFNRINVERIVPAPLQPTE